MSLKLKILNDKYDNESIFFLCFGAKLFFSYIQHKRPSGR